MAKNSNSKFWQRIYKGIIYNFKVQMPSLDQVSMKCCIWKNYKHYDYNSVK